ncbi:unnamed protein product [Lymnaea stagnalis]|uniref:Rho-GAP domain-containing protein n=1 Tax=Lymnaea stagnalis TaxID=6523 RepID=A0AAV2HQ93_LYMST
METRDLLKGLRFYNLMMAPEHRDSLQMLLTVLNALTQNSAENGLTVEDCANIFWPILFSLPSDCSGEETAKRKKQFFDLTRVLVHYNDYLFTVSPEMLNKLRRLKKRGDEPDPKFNEQLEPRPRMTAISFASMDLKSPEFKDGLKRFTFNSSTTAEELVQFSTGEQLPMERLMEKLKCHILGKDSKTSHFLFEKGGNLGSLEERVLDPKTKIISLYRENSSATYVIKAWNGYHVEMSVKVIGNIPRQRPVYGEGRDLLLKEEKEEDY